jgi:hypothetical protein
MKSVNNKVRNLLTVFLVIALMVLSKYSFADTTDRNVNKSTPVDVKHVGTFKGQDLIQVNIENASGDKIEISFVDSEGYVLYEDVFTEKSISKKFLLDIPDNNFNSLQLIVRTQKQSQAQSFSIAKDVIVVEKTTIAKLK